MAVSTIVMNAIFQSFSIGSNVWLSLWSNDNTTVVNGTANTYKRDMYLGVYGALGLGQGMFFKIIILYYIFFYLILMFILKAFKTAF